MHSSVSCACRTLHTVQDKNAAPLNQLDVLMEETYEHIMDLADKVRGTGTRAMQDGRGFTQAGTKGLGGGTWG